MTLTFTMTAREIADCSDDELQRIVRISRAPINGTRFATQRELALAEMGKRVARAVEVEETALTLVEDRGRLNAWAWANHCAARDTSGFWRKVRDKINETAPIIN
jgi:hypothetical protein